MRNSILQINRLHILCQQRQCVQMLVAYGVRQDGARQLLSFLRTKGESQAHWEALLNDLYRRGLRGDKLLLVVTDGCPGLAAAVGDKKITPNCNVGLYCAQLSDS